MRLSWRGHAPRLLSGLLCLLGLAISTAAYAYLSGPVVELLLTGARRAPSGMLAQVPGLSSIAGAGPAMLWAVAVILVGVALLKGLSQLGASLLLDGTAERIGVELRQQLYGHLLRLPLAAHRRQASGDLLARLLDDARRVQESLVSAPIALVREGLGAAALLVVAFCAAPGLALIAALVLPVAGGVIALLGRAVKRAAAQAQQQLGELSARAAQGLTAIREVKSCSAEERELRRVEGHAVAALRWTLRHLRARALAPLANETMAAVALGVVLVYAGDRVGRGLLSPERFLSFFTALLLLYRPLKELGRAAHQRAAGRASLDRLQEVLAIEPEPISPVGPEPAPLRDGFVLERVSFGYPGAGEAVLEDLDLTLPVGKVVAVCGPSGAGKSTLVNICCGLEQPDRGALRWDGEDLAGAPPQRLRRAVSLVPQQPLILDGTVAENLRYGAPAADDGGLAEALEAAALAERVARLPAGIDTRLGSGGVQLSAGEAQRLAVARALLRGTSVIVLDEPTSALDPINQDRLIATLRRVAAASKAVLLIAHHPQLLGAADEVWELAEGRLRSPSCR